MRKYVAIMIRIPSNYIAVLIDDHFNSHNGMVINDVFEPAKHWSVRGRIISVCNRLEYHGGQVAKLNRKGVQNSVLVRTVQQLVDRSVEFDTPLEVMVGDDVIFHYMSHLACVEDGLFFDSKEGRVLLIKYDLLYMAIRSSQQILLNGFIMVEPIEKSKDIILGMMEVYTPETEEIGVGIVRQLGSHNKDYLHLNITDNLNVSLGDKVFFRHTLGLGIEHKYHQTIKAEGIPFYRMQRKDILAYEHTV